MKMALQGITKQFDEKNGVKTVLQDISFEVDEGQFITLLGPSGCGKTTLLTILAGFQKQNSGTITIDGKQVTGPGPDRAFVFQNYALFPWMSVKDNILFPMVELKVPQEQREQRLEHLLEISKLKGQEELYPHQISGGMKQRTALVRALASEPKVLLMDEPLGALDLRMRQSLQSELEEIWMQERPTVIMVTHDVDEAVYLSDRIILMTTDRGRIAMDFKNDLERPRNRRSAEYIRNVDILTERLSGDEECDRL